MKKYFFLAAAAAMMLSACSNDRDIDSVNEGPIPLTVGYSFGDLVDPSVATRGNNTGLQNDSISNDKTIGIFVMKEGQTTASETYERINVPSTALTYNTPAAKYSLVTTGVSLLYPEDKEQKIDIYAYAPYISNTTDATKSNIPASPFGVEDATTKIYGGNLSSNKITFFTEVDQTQNTAYWASDVLWGCAGTGEYVEKANWDGTTQTPEGPYHKLSKTDNNKEISAKEYMTIRTNGTPSSPTQGSSGVVDAYYLDKAASNAFDDNKAHAIVPMLHRGSKIIVNLSTNGMAIEKLRNADVIFNVDSREGELNILTGDFTAKTATSTSDIYLTKRLGIADWVGRTYNSTSTKWDLDAVTPDGVDASGNYTCSAVVIPQNLTSRSLIKIVLYNDCQQKINDGTYWDSGTDYPKWSKSTATYTYTGSANLEAGKKYTYDITVTATGLTVTVTVADWVNVSAESSGKAYLE